VSGCRWASELGGRGRLATVAGWAAKSIGGVVRFGGCIGCIDGVWAGFLCCRFPTTGLGRTPAPAKSEEAEVNYSNFANSSCFFWLNLVLFG